MPGTATGSRTRLRLILAAIVLVAGGLIISPLAQDFLDDEIVLQAGWPKGVSTVSVNYQLPSSTDTLKLDHPAGTRWEGSFQPYTQTPVYVDVAALTDTGDVTCRIIIRRLGRTTTLVRLQTGHAEHGLAHIRCVWPPALPGPK